LAAKSRAAKQTLTRSREDLFRIRDRRSVRTGRTSPFPRLDDGGDSIMEDHRIITPRRNLLIRALGFTAAGATVSLADRSAEAHRLSPARTDESGLGAIPGSQAVRARRWESWRGCTGPDDIIATVSVRGKVRPFQPILTEKGTAIKDTTGPQAETEHDGQDRGFGDEKRGASWKTVLSLATFHVEQEPIN
jgi:hypothetical protein